MNMELLLDSSAIQSSSSCRKVQLVSLIKFHFTGYNGYIWCCGGGGDKLSTPRQET